ncbi:LysR family transcriptional regulator [uncultured Clostridium sp.]|uniref:LysR family transcriptional regulator n=1 Tax=uncultured Clostridium sp. TaxID=59620 RepID=UPI0025EE89C7|nr:LysR family transcriptional regulator [uncultured Clostridium sp.]
MCYRTIRTLNFRKASENLFISQPSLTYQIQTLEEELGFTLFYRSAKGAELTPAGEQFCSDLIDIKDDMKNAIERGKNFSNKYTDSLSISVPLRSAIYFLPHIMKQFKNEFPHTSLNIKYIYGNNRVNSFLRGNEQIIFGLKTQMECIPQINLHKLFDSHIYLVSQKEDPLASLEIITPEDLKDRTIMIGGGSPPELQKVQKFIINSVHVNTFNSADHMTTLTNIAAGNGICLVPGFCNNHLDEFAWTPVSFDIPIECVLATHKEDNRESAKKFIQIAQKYYKTTTIQL